MEPGNRSDENRQCAAVCGLYCKACSLYIGSTEDTERLEATAKRFGVTAEDARCYGCQSDVRSFYCRTCAIKTCAAERSVAFCGQCADYPCERLKEFQAELPHRAELFESCERIRDVGCDQWFEEVRARHTCPECQTINPAYDLTCRKCGNEPGSPFVAKHRDKIETVLATLAEDAEQEGADSE